MPTFDVSVGNNSAITNLRRFIPAGKKTINSILKRGEVFVAWAVRKRYSAIILPLETFTSKAAARKVKQLKEQAEKYGIAIEAGGRSISSLVPGKNFFLHRDYFRMAEGKRVKRHHFCPTNPDTLKAIKKEATRLFHAAAGIKVFHLWPDKGAENTWCSCPPCRAFTPSEQNCITVNAAADALASVDPRALITYFERSGEDGNILARKNLVKMDRLPDEKDFPDPTTQAKETD